MSEERYGISRVIFRVSHDELLRPSEMHTSNTLKKLLFVSIG